MKIAKYQPTFRRAARLGVLTGCTLVSLVAVPKLGAAADAWTVVQGSGPAVHQLANGQSTPLKIGDIVAEGDSVQTGPDGRWVLQHHEHADTVTVSPGSQFRIPDPHRESAVAAVVQSMGTLLFDVEHTPGRRFEVDGPYLAAVVKGTSFTVAVTPGGSTVNVTRGAVEVQSPMTHGTALVGPGQFAAVAASGRHELSVGRSQTSAVPRPGATGGPAPGNRGQGVPGPAGMIGEAHLDVGALTNNLVTNTGAAGSTVGPSGVASSTARTAAPGSPAPTNGPAFGSYGAAPGAAPGVGPVGMVGSTPGQPASAARGAPDPTMPMATATPAATATPTPTAPATPTVNGNGNANGGNANNGNANNNGDNGHGNANNDNGNNGNGNANGNGNGNGNRSTADAQPHGPPPSHAPKAHGGH
jgi:hypothetical protein